MEYKDIYLNQDVTLREEFDEWAILFNSETAHTYTINPMGVFIWKQLKKNSSIEVLIKNIEQIFSDTPENIEHDIYELLSILIKNNLATENAN